MYFAVTLISVEPLPCANAIKGNAKNTAMISTQPTIFFFNAIPPLCHFQLHIQIHIAHAVIRIRLIGNYLQLDIGVLLIFLAQ